jgi:YD repeat-containing protein
MKNRMIFCTAALLAIMAGGATNALAQDNDDPTSNTTSTTTVTNATGTITQLNYDENGAIEGFLLGTNILLSFPTNVCGGIGTLGAVINTVTYSGTARTNSTTAFQTVSVTNFTNNTTNAKYTRTTSTPTSTAYGPTSGTVKLLNYDSSGAIDGFLFTPSGSTTAVLVVTGSGASATLKPLLAVGGTVSVTGTTSTNSIASACVVTGALTVVKTWSLIIGGQTIIISGSGGGERGNH